MTTNEITFERDQDDAFTVNVWGPADERGFCDHLATISTFGFDGAMYLTVEGQREVQIPNFKTQAEVEAWVAKKVSK